MAIQTLHDTGTEHTVLSKMDGGVYQISARDCVIGGIGDEFTLNYSTESLNVSFNAGSEAVIGGSFFKVTSLEALTLVANSTIYLCANIDLSKPNGSIGGFVQRTNSNIQSENINGSGTSRDLLLYVITTGATGVVSVTDRRDIVSKAFDSSQLANVATTGSYNDLKDKPTIPTYTVNNGTLTIQRNGSNVGSFSANQGSNTTINITVPTNTNQLTNGSGFLTSHQPIGVNFGNQITTINKGGSWTTNQKCWVYMRREGSDIRYGATVTIAGKNAFTGYVQGIDPSNPGGAMSSWVLVPSGVTISCSDGEGKCYCTIYGLA